MTLKRSCHREDELRQVAARDPDDPALLAHVEACATCRESRAAALWMREISALPLDNEASMPADAVRLWWRAQLLRRWDAQRQAALPVEIGERVMVGIGLAAAVVLLRWLWDELPALTASAAPVDAASIGGVSTIVTLVTIMSVALLAATAFAAVRDLFDRD
jgi:hypothetical protein